MGQLAVSIFANYDQVLMKHEENIFSPETNPLSVGILLLPDSNMLSLAACIDPLRAANRRADRNVFKWRLYSPDGGDVPLTSAISVATEALTARPDFDVLIVVAGFRLTEHTTPTLLRRLRDVAPRLRAIGGVDGGPWLLARSGLLDGQTATTHWEDLEEFTDVFPAINVVQDRFTISGKYFTAGGAIPTIDLMLHLIQRRLGAKLAQSVAGAFIYDVVQSPSAPQLPVSTQRLQRNSPKLAQVITVMGKSIEDPPSIATLARQAGLTQRGLELLFQKQLGQSPGAFFLNHRLHEARRLALDTALSAHDISLRAGFSSQAVFARAFRREFGMSLRDLRHMHRQ